jgi:phytoene dehydrogenase-like protein
MRKTASDTYDAVIIGAGISGLVCGCYLAKAGMNVLIAEQHFKPGGYCTSFKRNGFSFDAAAHSLGGYKYGHVGKVFKFLEIEKKIKFAKIDPSDIIATPDYRVSFWTDGNRTIGELQRAFPDESDNIKRFFYFLNNPSPHYFAQVRRWTFKNLLDQYFINDKLKTVLSFPLFGNGGLPPSLMSAFIGIKIYQEFLLDGGYYPEGGMQNLSNALAERFKELGGDLRLSCFVNKIRVTDGKVTGIVLKKAGFIQSKYVVSNCDARQTFLKLLEREVVSQSFLSSVATMVPSLSGFILYLGVDKRLHKMPHPGTNLWYLSHYNLDNAYSSTKAGNFKNIEGYVMHISPDKKTIFAFMHAPFKNVKYWALNKTRIRDLFINKIASDSIPELMSHIVYKDAATPHTLHRYTLNYKGAAYGWASVPSQLAVSDFKKPSFIKNLYLTGHWTTHGLGIPGVVYVGSDTAISILKKEKIML